MGITMGKYLMMSFCVIGALFGATGEPSSPDSSGKSPMHKLQQRHPDKLPNAQRHVMYSLSPLYQRIFMYSLTDDQREDVTMYEQKGENPYAVIDRILRRDRELTDRNFNRSNCSPCQRTRFAGQRNRYINSGQGAVLDADEDQVLEDNPEDDVEMYGESDQGSDQGSDEESDEEVSIDPKTDYSNKVNKVDTTVKKASVKKEMKTTAKKGCTSCGKKACCSKKAGSCCKKSFFSRCKEYFSKEEKVQTCRKYQYIDPNAEKRRQRSQQVHQY
jgi:hypothetical protein